MKTTRFLLAALMLACLGGNAWADTDKLPAADGWTKITTLPTATDIANNYYVIVDNSQDLMLTISNGSHNKGKWYSLSLWYQTSVSPTTSGILSKLWILQKGSYGDGSYALQNVEYPARLIQTEYEKAYLMETNDVSSPNDWSKLNFAYSNGYWTIENGQYPASSGAGYKGYLGPWEETEAITNLPNNRELAGNKLGDFIGRFQIYTISRTKFKENYLAAASSSNPVDVSFIYVNNPTLDLNIDGWTRSASSLGGTAAGNYCTETWHSSTDFKFYQNVASLPEGAYQVSVQARSQTNSGAVYATVGENTVSTPVNTTTSSTSMQTEATTMFDRTTGKITTPSISLDEGQSLTMGFKENVANHWDVFDNFKLYYLGNDLSVYAAARDAVKTTAENAIASDLVPNACEDAIQTVIDNNSGDYTTKAEYVAAQNAIQTALDTYFTDAIKSAYANVYAFKTKVETLKDGQGASSALTTFNTAISDATTAVEAATTAAAIETQISNLRSAGLTYISSVEGQFDITFLASQNYSDWKKKDGSAAGIVQDQFLANRPNTIPSFAENFEWTAATTGNVLYQTVSDLPAGYYQVGMYTMALSTSQRDNIATEATEDDSNRSFAFAGDLTDNESIQRTGMPIKFATAVDFEDLTALDVNVHLSSAGALTFGVQKDANGSNWHFAQIVSIVYSSTPDLTGLKATRDALVAEAEGLLANEDASLLTTEQQNALSTAVGTANSANTFETLNTVTLTTLPNAINTAKQQISVVKANRVQMIAALERFENDYNLADGTDYRRVTMSADAWATLITKVNAVTTALDDVSQASSYGTIKDELVTQMDATDASLRLFKSYKAMADGTVNVLNGDAAELASTSDTDDDDAETEAIPRLNTAFVNYALAQDVSIDMGAFLGENLDFSAEEGTALNTDNDNNIHAVTGWEVEYANADTWAVLQTHQSENGELYMRKNWGSAATILKVSKQKMLPVGKYTLSFSWNNNMENMTNLSQYKLGNEVVAIGEATDGARTLSYEFEVVGAPKTFDLVFGFQKEKTDNNPAQLVVDDVVLTYTQPTVTLANTGDNTTVITANSGKTCNVTLAGRTLYKDGSWNTLCLPFDLGNPYASAGHRFDDTPLEGATVMTLANSPASGTGFDAQSGMLSLYFVDADGIEAGKPYIVKWIKPEGYDGHASDFDIVNPVFRAVTISNEDPDDQKVVFTGGKFMGTYASTTYEEDNRSILFMGGENTLYWPKQGATIGTQRAYFQMNDGNGAKIRNFSLNFDGEATSIHDAQFIMYPEDAAWYTLSGVKLQGRPTAKGFYLHGDQKVFVP